MPYLGVFLADASAVLLIFLYHNFSSFVWHTIHYKRDGTLLDNILLLDFKEHFSALYGNQNIRIMLRPELSSQIMIRLET
jgi:hypothetical protein